MHSYGSRSGKKGNLNVKFVRQNKRVNMSISFIVVKLWNQLDANFRNVKTINIFKHIIKNMLISLYDSYRC